MGFFSLKATCMVCQKEIGLNRFKAKDGWVCPDCFKKCGYTLATPIGLKTLADVQADMAKLTQHVQAEVAKVDEEGEENGRLAEQKEKLAAFNATKKIDDYIEFDEGKRQWLIPTTENLFGLGEKRIPRIYSFDDIVEYEWLEDGQTIKRDGVGVDLVDNNNSGRRSKPVVSNFKIKITVNDFQNPNRYINLIDDDETELDSYTYQEAYTAAMAITTTLSLIIKVRHSQTAAAPANEPKAEAGSAADEIMKFKTLLDSGVITPEEFEAKKKQLLGL